MTNRGENVIIVADNGEYWWDAPAQCPPSPSYHRQQRAESDYKVNGFFGQYNVNLGPKGRISLPARIRPRNGDGSPAPLVLTRGFENCLALYPEDEWSALHSHLDGLPTTSRDFRLFSRIMYSAAVIVTPDSQGRFLIPSYLLKFAHLKRQALVLGANRWIEIWDPEKFDHTLDQPGGGFEDVAERLFNSRGPERR